MWSAIILDRERRLFWRVWTARLVLNPVSSATPLEIMHATCAAVVLQFCRSVGVSHFADNGGSTTPRAEALPIIRMPPMMLAFADAKKPVVRQAGVPRSMAVEPSYSIRAQAFTPATACAFGGLDFWE